jgi:mRNA interferase MazF
MYLDLNIDLSKVQESLDWMKTKLFLHTQAQSAKTRVVKRGEVYRCNFGRGIGSEMEKDRPAVILQNDIGNLKSPNTIVAPITHSSSALPCMVPIVTRTDSAGRITLDGSVNTSNTVCVSKARLGKFVDVLTPQEMKDVNISLASTLGLLPHYIELKKKLDDKLSYIDKIKFERNAAQDSI